MCSFCENKSVREKFRICVKVEPFNPRRLEAVTIKGL